MPLPVVAVIVVIKDRLNTSKNKIYFYLISIYFYFSENYQPTEVTDSSPKAYDNKIHVSEIYGNSRFLKRKFYEDFMWYLYLRF